MPVKDLIGNVLSVGDKVHIQLVNPQIFGFIGEIVEPPLVTRVNRAEARPGHILVSCVVAIPIDPTLDGVAQIVRVYDANKAQADAEAQRITSQPN